MPDQANNLRALVNKADNSQANDLRLLTEKPPNAIQNFAQQMAGSVVDAADAIEPLLGVASVGFNKLTGRQRGESMREAVNIPEKNDRLSGRMGSLAGEAAAIAVPVGGAATRVGTAAQGAGRVRTAVQNTVNAMGNQFRATPGRVIAGEAVAGASAGAGGYFAQQKFPDSPVAQFVGEMAGGFGPQVATQATGAALRGTGNAGIWVAEKLPIARFLVAGGRKAKDMVINARDVARLPGSIRGSRRFDRASSDRSAAVAGLDEDVAARDVMTIAQRSGDVGLMELERDVLNQSDKLRRGADEQLQALNSAIQDSAQMPGNPDDLADSFENTQAYLSSLVDARIHIAAQKTDELVERLLPANDLEAANRIARRQIGRALTASRAQEKQLYDLIPPDTIVPTANGRAMVADLLARTPEAQKGDIPAIAIELMGPKGRGRNLGTSTSLREVRGLQSKLREISRNSRAGDTPNFNQARIADDLADTLLDDIEAAGGDVKELVDQAVGFSRMQAEKFRQGTVGRILGHQATGAEVIPEGRTLDATLGARSGRDGGSQGREVIDDLLRADASPQMRQVLSDFVHDDFLHKTMKEGQFNRDAAVTYLADNREMLNRMPELRQQYQEIIESGNAEILARADLERVDFRKDLTSLFIQNKPKQAFDQVMGSRSPRREMRNLMGMAQMDQTGRAMDGLKASYSEYLLNSVMDGDFVSGAKLREHLSDVRRSGAMQALYSPAETRRMNQVLGAAHRLDLARTASSGSGEGVLGDTPAAWANTLAGILGAAYGRQLSEKMGGGTVQIPGIVADKFRGLLESGVSNPAKRLIEDAIQDEDLFKTLLQTTTEFEADEVAMSRLNAWTIAVITEEEER